MVACSKLLDIARGQVLSLVGLWLSITGWEASWWVMTLLAQLPIDDRQVLTKHHPSDISALGWWLCHLSSAVMRKRLTQMTLLMELACRSAWDPGGGVCLSLSLTAMPSSGVCSQQPRPRPPLYGALPTLCSHSIYVFPEARSYRRGHHSTLGTPLGQSSYQIILGATNSISA